MSLVPRALRARALEGAYGPRWGDTKDRLQVGPWAILVDDQCWDPRPRWGIAPPTYLGTNLDLRPGERALVVRDPSGVLALWAAAKGARVTLSEDRPVGTGNARRNVLMGGFGAPDLQPWPPDDGPWDAVVWWPGFLDAGGPAAPVRDAGFEQELLGRLPKLVGRGGRLLTVWPRDFGGAGFEALLRDAGLRFAVTDRVEAPMWGPVELYRAWVPRAGETAGPVPAGVALAGARWVRRGR